MRIPHLTLNFSARSQRGHRVDDDERQGPRSNQGICDLEGLLSVVRLGDQELIGVDAELSRVIGIQCMFRVDEGADPALGLRIRDGVESNGGFSR